MVEVLIKLSQDDWRLIENGIKTIVAHKTKPEQENGFFHEFRAIVCLTDGSGVVGKFDVNKIINTIRPESLARGCCRTESELIGYAAGSPVCGWCIKENSVLRYETPFDLEYATGFKEPPETWAYLHREIT